MVFLIYNSRWQDWDPFSYHEGLEKLEMTRPTIVLAPGVLLMIVLMADAFDLHPSCSCCLEFCFAFIEVWHDPLPVYWQRPKEMRPLFLQHVHQNALYVLDVYAFKKWEPCVCITSLGSINSIHIDTVPFPLPLPLHVRKSFARQSCLIKISIWTTVVRYPDQMSPRFSAKSYASHLWPKIHPEAQQVDPKWWYM